MPNLAALSQIIAGARQFVAASDDFSWTSWNDKQDALRELDRATEHLVQGSIAPLPMLFAPTGPMQELSLSNGWGDAFVDLANRYEVAIGCECLSDPSIPKFARELGMDRHFAEISVLTCPQCGQLWLRYYYVVEGITGSGHWYLGRIWGEVSADEAQAALEQMPWYFYGGSYFDGRVGKASGPIARYP